jgi:hypothetical protein
MAAEAGLPKIRDQEFNPKLGDRALYELAIREKRPNLFSLKLLK